MKQHLPIKLAAPIMITLKTLDWIELRIIDGFLRVSSKLKITLKTLDLIELRKNENWGFLRDFWGILFTLKTLDLIELNWKWGFLRILWIFEGLFYRFLMDFWWIFEGLFQMKDYIEDIRFNWIEKNENWGFYGFFYGFL